VYHGWRLRCTLLLITITECSAGNQCDSGPGAIAEKLKSIHYAQSVVLDRDHASTDVTSLQLTPRFSIDGVGDLLGRDVFSKE
jgi:hypothetical protein